MSHEIKLFLAGDIMTGRGIDQTLPHPVSPQLYETWMRDARDYVALAEQRSGSIARPVEPGHLWGPVPRLLAREQVQWRIANLETAVTESREPWPGKGVHYHMHPANALCLRGLGLHCCTLANNHLLDWGYGGLTDTLATLARLGITACGAGANSQQAVRPAVLSQGERRLLIFSYAFPTSGTPKSWAAAPDRAGANWLPDCSAESVERIVSDMAAWRDPDDRVIISLHWGPNWGYTIENAQRRFARALVDAGADLIHGHSSHHPIGMEVYRDRLLLYGCGDFINDYEGIHGHEHYRPHLSVAYLPQLDSDGRLANLRLYSLRIRKLRLEPAAEDDAAWLVQMFNRESRGLRLTTDKSTAETPRLEAAIRP